MRGVNPRDFEATSEEGDVLEERTEDKLLRGEKGSHGFEEDVDDLEGREEFNERSE